MPDPVAIVLAGGLGTRIRDLHPDTPKALIPVAGRPFLAWQLDALAAAGIRRVRIAAGHLADHLTVWLASHPDPRFEIDVRVETQPLGTAGALRHAAHDLPAVPLLVMNGDTLLPKLDLRAMCAIRGARAVMAVAQVADAARFGTLKIDARNLVRAFSEKGATGPGWINGGAYLLDPAILRVIAPDRAVSLERDIFPRLADAASIQAFRAEGPLLDMGTPDGLAEMEAFLRKR